MEKDACPNVRRLYEGVAGIAQEAENIQHQQIASGKAVVDSAKFVVMALRHSRAMLRLTDCLFSHPEWWWELDRLLAEDGCPAFKVPVVELFLVSKGVV